MVYFKINADIKKLIEKVALDKLIGCEKNCDQQLISYNDLELLVEVHNNRESKKKAPEPISLHSVAEKSVLLFMETHQCNSKLENNKKRSAAAIIKSERGATL